MEREAKNFQEKRALEERIALLEKRRKWALVEEERIECQVLQ